MDVRITTMYTTAASEKKTSSYYLIEHSMVCPNYFYPLMTTNMTQWLSQLLVTISSRQSAPLLNAREESRRHRRSG